MSSRLLLPLLVTSSLFLVHCSSGDDDSGNHTAGSGATGGSAVAGTGGTTGGSAGTMSSGATGGSSGTGAGGSAGASTTGGQGGASGPTAGSGGSAGAMAGRGSAGTSGAAGHGAGAGGNGSGGMSGASGNAGFGASGTGGAVGAGAGGQGAAGAGGTGGSGAFTLTSSVITEGGMFPAESTCASSPEASPDLTWTAGPSGTMSYAVILLDTNNSLNHWVVWDIPSTVTSLPGMLDTSAMLSMPAGAQQKAVSGMGYFGPCPNGMDHVYEFTVYALPVAMLPGVTTSSQTSALATAVMNANPLASASLSAHSSAKMN